MSKTTEHMEPSDTSAEAENIEKSKSTILVIDDEPVLLALAQGQIEDLGYAVLCSQQRTSYHFLWKQS